MNEQKVRAEIEKVLEQYKNKVWHQYPATKVQIAKLTELGIVDLMPRRAKGNVIGNYDAQLVIAAAEDAGGKSTGGFTAWGEGDVVRTIASALYQALHEAEPAAEDDAEDDEPVEVERYSCDDPSAEDGEQVYIVYRRGSVYELDAEWSDGPAAEFDHLPTVAEVEVVHQDYLEATRLIDDIARAESEAAEAEQRRFEEQQAAIVEQHLAIEAQRSELRPLPDFAHLAVPDTLRRAAIEGRLEAEKLGRDWLTTERDVRRYLKSRYHTSKRLPEE